MEESSFHLGFVERMLVGVLLAVGGQAAEMEIFRCFFDGDEIALDQRGERGGWDAELAQVCDSHASSGSGEFGEDGGLVLVEFGDAGIGDEDGDALGAAGVAFFGYGFAEEPLLADHAVEQGLAGLRGGTQGGGGRGAAVFEVVEDGVFAVLVFGREFRAAGRAFLCALVEDAAAGVGDAVGEVAADFGGERHHGAEDFAEGCDVVLGDPGGKLHEFGREQGSVVENLLDGFDFYAIGGWVVVHADDDAEQALATEGDEDASAECGHSSVNRVSEDAVERDGQGDVAVGRHCIPEYRRDARRWAEEALWRTLVCAN